jgi:hypothetical protein
MNSEGYHVERNFAFITSRDRNIAVFPKSTNFNITLPDDYNDVVSVELTAGTVPNLDGVVNEPYLLLSIKEFNHIKMSNGNDYFSVLAIHKGQSDLFFNLDRSSAAIMPRKFYSPLQRLTSITLELLKSDGKPLTFGANSNIDAVNQVSFTFEIKTLSKNRIEFDKDFRDVF